PLPAPEPLAAAAVPDGDAAATLDLPRAVAADRRGLLVDADDRQAARCLKDQERGHRLRKCVVVGDDRGPRHDPEATAPAQGPEQAATAQVPVSAREGHRPG